MNDTELIEGCKAGKREALETIYRLFSRQMYGVCYRYVGTFIKYYKISQLIHTQSIAN